MVLLVLLALGGFVGFIAQLDDVGKGTYGAASAIAFVLLVLPSQIFQYMPMAALLGSLMGLGRLASQSELTVMRAAGVSPMRIAMSVLGVGIALTLMSAALGEFIAPPLERYAKHQRTMLKNQDLQISSRQDLWLKHENMVINARPKSSENWEGGVYVFSFGEDKQLVSLGRADGAELGSDGQWLLQNLQSTRFTDKGVAVDPPSAFKLGPGLNPELMEMSKVNPDTMSSIDLYGYGNYLRRNNLNSENYDTALWFRLASVVSISLMTVLAVPFVFGSLRSSGSGVRVMIGVMIGAGYFLLNRTLANSGQVFDLNPVVVASLPTLALALVALIGVLRIR
jgi:lipopolysaccharide export system permease protein